MIGPFFLWIALLLGAIGVADWFWIGVDTNDYSYALEVGRCIDFSEFMERVEAGVITEVHFQDQSTLVGYVANNQLEKSVHTKIPPRMSCENIVWKLLEKGVRVRVDEGDKSFSRFLAYAIQWLLPLLLAGSLIYVLRGRRGLMGLGMSSAFKDAEVPDVGFKDVAGVDNAKDSLQEIVQFLKDPVKFRRLGAAVPRGVLLYGPPGTGKTLLARCVAGESNASFMYASGSSFVEVYVGLGARKIRDAFKKARSKAPCILFIDEIDVLAGKRRSGPGDGGGEEHAQTVTQFLEEMDGFEQHKDSVVVVIAATNRKDMIDPAALRPGRFDRHIYVGLPQRQDRERIFRVHLSKIKHDPDLDVARLAKKTQGCSGAEIKNLVNEAALIATKDETKEFVGMREMLLAWDNIFAGPITRSDASEQQRRITAYHEAGHAVIALVTDSHLEVDRVTIIPRGDSAGMLISTQKEEREMVTRSQLLDDITVTLGGRAAEAVVFGQDKVTTGASQDFIQATETAQRMVFSWGMAYDSELSGDDCNLTVYDPYRAPMAIAPEVMNQRGAMVRKIVHMCYQRAVNIVREKRLQIDKVVEYLFERETLTRDELQTILSGKELAPLPIDVPAAADGAEKPTPDRDNPKTKSRKISKIDKPADVDQASGGTAILSDAKTQGQSPADSDQQKVASSRSGKNDGVDDRPRKVRKKVVRDDKEQSAGDSA
jgi:cell division protease FtsH